MVGKNIIVMSLEDAKRLFEFLLFSIYKASKFRSW